MEERNYSYKKEATIERNKDKYEWKERKLIRPLIDQTNPLEPKKEIIMVFSLEWEMLALTWILRSWLPYTSNGKKKTHTYQGCLSWRALILNLVCYSLVRSTMSQYNIESLIKMEFKYFRIVCGWIACGSNLIYMACKTFQ